MKKSVWLSYDLGIKGDYPNLYKWLDNKSAKECGNSIAFFNYEFTSDLKKELALDLETAIEFKPGDRIYVIYLNKEGDKTTMKGSFIIGKRKSNPWEGSGDAEDPIVDGDE